MIQDHIHIFKILKFALFYGVENFKAWLYPCQELSAFCGNNTQISNACSFSWRIFICRCEFENFKFFYRNIDLNHSFFICLCLSLSFVRLSCVFANLRLIYIYFGIWISNVCFSPPLVFCTLYPFPQIFIPLVLLYD